MLYLYSCLATLALLLGFSLETAKARVAALKSKLSKKP